MGGGGEAEAEEQRRKEEAVSGCPANTAQAGRAQGCEGCPGQQFCRSNVAREDPMQRKLDVRMAAVARKVLVLSGKGGVGKSSLAAELSACLAVARGRRVGLLDVDVCGPSAPLLTQLSGAQVAASEFGWTAPSPAWSDGRLLVMSAGFLLAGRDTPVVWRGPRKTCTSLPPPLQSVCAIGGSFFPGSL